MLPFERTFPCLGVKMPRSSVTGSHGSAFHMSFHGGWLNQETHPPTVSEHSFSTTIPPTLAVCRPSDILNRLKFYLGESVFLVLGVLWHSQEANPALHRGMRTLPSSHIPDPLFNTLLFNWCIYSGFEPYPVILKIYHHVRPWVKLGPSVCKAWTQRIKLLSPVLLSYI